MRYEETHFEDQTVPPVDCYRKSCAMGECIMILQGRIHGSEAVW